jgi:hypothetical protein
MPELEPELGPRPERGRVLGGGWSKPLRETFQVNMKEAPGFGPDPRFSWLPVELSSGQVLDSPCLAPLEEVLAAAGVLHVLNADVDALPGDAPVDLLVHLHTHRAGGHVPHDAGAALLPGAYTRPLLSSARQRHIIQHIVYRCSPHKPAHRVPMLAMAYTT